MCCFQASCKRNDPSGIWQPTDQAAGGFWVRSAPVHNCPKHSRVYRLALSRLLGVIAFVLLIGYLATLPARRWPRAKSAATSMRSEPHLGRDDAGWCGNS